MEQTEKQKKAIKILIDKKIGECCEWLLRENSANALREVTNVEHVKQVKHHFCGFFYNNEHYELGLKSQNPPTLGDSYDFLIKVASQPVLEAKIDEYYMIIKINLDSLSMVALGEWIEIIPKIVTEAKVIGAKQQQQKEYVEETERQREQEKKAKEMDENIDLGEYE